MSKYLTQYGFKTGDTVRLLVASFTDGGAHAVLPAGIYKAEDITELAYQLGGVVLIESATKEKTFKQKED